MKYRSTNNFVRKKMYLVSIYKFLSFAGTVLLAYLLLFRIILLTYSVSHWESAPNFGNTPIHKVHKYIGI
jgi:hypothetical protein